MTDKYMDKNVLVHLSGAGGGIETQENHDTEERNIKFNPALTGDALWRCCEGDFVIDLATLKFNKDRLTIDYNHDESEVIGYAMNFQKTPSGLIADGVLVSAMAGDRSDSVYRQLKAGVPLEVSPTLELYSGSIEELEDGQTAMINDREISGPITIFKNVPVRGLSVCPYGTDAGTCVNALKKENLTEEKMIFSKRKNGLTRMAKSRLSEEGGEGEVKEKEKVLTDCSEEAGAEGTEGATQYTAYPELETFIENFGLEKGVEYYRRGLTLEEAQAEDYAELKAARLAEEEEPKDSESGNIVTDPQEEKLSAQFSGVLKKLNFEIQQIRSALKRGDHYGASSGLNSEGQENSGLNAWQRLAVANSKRGTKRN